MKGFYLLLITVMFGSSTFAGDTKTAAQKIADQYYKSLTKSANTTFALQSLGFSTRTDDNHCYKRPSCLRTACEINKDLCDDSYDLKKTNEVCANANDECVAAACKTNPDMCNDHYDLKRTVDACGTTEGICVAAACRVNLDLCNDSYDLKRTADACMNANGECVEMVCEQNHDSCNDVYDLKRTVDACAR